MDEHPWGCAPGISYGHFGMQYIPQGGSIHIGDPYLDKDAPFYEIGNYDVERDMIRLPRRKKSGWQEIPAAKFHGTYHGDFWPVRRRLLNGRDGVTGGRRGKDDDWHRRYGEEECHCACGCDRCRGRRERSLYSG